MSSSGASPSLADRLVTACYNGDLPSAKAAVADGASVNQKGMALEWCSEPPLSAAVDMQHHDVVVWLLSHGADPNGANVMWYGACHSTAAMLQLLIDAGGDVNRECCEEPGPPLFPVVWDGNGEDNVRVLLAQPSLDLTIKCDGESPEENARNADRPAVADMIAQEVSGKCFSCLRGAACGDGVCGDAVAGRS